MEREREREGERRDGVLDTNIRNFYISIRFKQFKILEA